MKIDTTKQVKGYTLCELEPQAIAQFAPFCRKVAAEGAVLLKNDNGVLPFAKGEKVAVFGRTQFDYYKSGTGSGGLVNVEYVTNITDSLIDSGDVQVNMELVDTYKNWLKDNPFDVGQGWAMEPWCQKEMPITDEIAACASKTSESALVVFGRTAGEDKDNHNTEGSYKLKQEEKDILENVCKHFDKVAVVLNVGNIIDMSFVDEYKVDSVMYVWHGGMEGGRAVADLVCGKVTPSGKLTDTIAYNVEDYPSNDNFGDEHETLYVEDVYVGYRYFETFCPQKVRYPFGFGLSYTDFEIKTLGCTEKDGEFCVKVQVKNTGKVQGKEVVQVYVSAPQGKLGKPAKVLVGYQKTDLLEPNEAQTLEIKFDCYGFSSFDDSGVTGNKNCYVLEQGVYTVFVGNSVRNNTEVYTYGVQETLVVDALQEAVAPTKEFDRIRPKFDGEKLVVDFEKVPTREIDIKQRIVENRMADIEFTGDKGFKLIDVVDGKCSLEQFVAQIETDDLIAMVKGEGMNSYKVTAGTGGAFGGVTDNLLEFGIPVCCVTDGPSGVRMDSGALATAMPIGTLLASTFNDELIEELHIYEGLELRANRIDALLGPGLNIHRHPLNGRNFEYFSEDPLVSGKMAAAITRGIAQSGPSSTIKHFACNNQEIGRSSADSVVSQRALREIYLKGFEIAVKEGGATALMTAYNPVNGFWTAGSHDLNTTILRNEWGYSGFVMTDWWAKMNEEGEQAYNTNTKYMVRAQNDVFMVCKSADAQPDNIKEGIAEGTISISDLQRCCMNLLRYIINSPTFENYVLGGCVKPEFIGAVNDESMTDFVTIEMVENGKEYSFTLPPEVDGKTGAFVYDISVDAPELSQFWATVFVDANKADEMSVCGSDGKTFQIKSPCEISAGAHTISVSADSVLKVEKLVVKY